jgi:hypothetical protein
MSCGSSSPTGMSVVGLHSPSLVTANSRLLKWMLSLRAGVERVEAIKNTSEKSV